MSAKIFSFFKLTKKISSLNLKETFSSLNIASDRLSPKKRLLIGAASLFVGIALLWPSQKESFPQRIPVELNVDSLLSTINLHDDVSVVVPHYEKTIVKGDSLSQLFSAANVNQKTMYKVLEADLNVLALDTLKPGNTIRFWLDNSGRLAKLELYFDASHQVVFERYKNGDGFKVKEVNIKGVWQNRILGGDIHGSFYMSARRSGLNAKEIQQIESLLKSKLNFSRDLRAGDQFSVLMSKQYIDGKATGNGDILGIHIQRGRRSINAYQSSDGSFYDARGRSLVRAFQRTPLLKYYRVSSPFNLHRLHPITGRISPHNGTDFATPVGTKIVAPADGVVTLVTNHRYAGKYLVISHGNKYKTRYLHLSKALVHPGQRVSRGQVIALSGNTGRITGPHLHYELSINGHPVNAMTARIPLAKPISHKKMKSFKRMVKVRRKMMGLG